MRLVLEVAADEFERASAHDVFALSVGEIEIRQTEAPLSKGGLLVKKRRVLLVEAVGSATRTKYGVDDQTPAMLVHCTEEE